MIMSKRVCKNCKWFNFKVSGENDAYGECLNKKVDTYIPFGKTDIMKYVKGESSEEIINNSLRISEKLSKYVGVYFNEETFGCIHFEKKK